MPCPAGGGVQHPAHEDIIAIYPASTRISSDSARRRLVAATWSHAIGTDESRNVNESHGIAPKPKRSARRPAVTGPTIVARSQLPFKAHIPPSPCAAIAYTLS